MRRTRIGKKDGPGISVDHWRLDRNASVTIDSVDPPCIYLKPKQIDALIRALTKARNEIPRGQR